MRHLNGRKYDSYAVLVGEFDSVSHPEIKRTLERIKYAHPKSLEPNQSGKTSQRFAALRELQKRIVNNEEKKRRGPMGMAFVSRNPLLPDVFFSAPTVDSFVRKMNENVQYSLLNNPGKYTVVVRVFEGNSTVDIGTGAQSSKLKSNPERLNRGAELAHRMVMALRKQNVPAYEFHDRYRSMVTVGEFESLGSQNMSGEFIFADDITRTMDRYSASGGTIDHASHGTHLKANHIERIPFDVNPHPIAVPKASKRSLYAGAMNLWR